MNPVPTPSAPIALPCPKCAGPMTTYERSGVHVDQCRECRGVFLDRGELERLIDLEAEAMAAVRRSAQLRDMAAGGAGGGGAAAGGAPAWGDSRPDPRHAPGDPGGGWYRDDDDDDDDDRRWSRRDDSRYRDERSRDDDHGRSRRRGFLGELFEALGD